MYKSASHAVAEHLGLVQGEAQKHRFMIHARRRQTHRSFGGNHEEEIFVTVAMTTGPAAELRI